MTIKHSSLDVYFHMRNHYKKLRLAKAVVKHRPSSAPKKLAPFSSSSSPARNEEPPKPTRPASETRELDPEDLQKLKKAHYPYHSIYLTKHDCCRPITRRNPSDMPVTPESTEEEHYGSDELKKEEPPDGQNADWGDLKEDLPHRQLGCNAGAVYAGGDEAYSNLGLRDIGYLEIWALEQSNDANKRYKDRKSVPTVYTVLPIMLDSGNESSDNTKKQETCSDKVKRCDRNNCDKLPKGGGGGGVNQASIFPEQEETSATERCTSESEIETSTQDRDSDANNEQHVESSTVTERSSRPKLRVRSKAHHRDSVAIAQERFRKSQIQNLSRRKPAASDEPRRKSPTAEKSGKRKSPSIESPKQSRKPAASDEPRRKSPSVKKSGRRKSPEHQESEAKEIPEHRETKKEKIPEHWETKKEKIPGHREVGLQVIQLDSFLINLQNYFSSEDANKPCSVRGCSVIEHEYLQFSLRITEDIIRNDLYNGDEMKRVFNSHIEANRGRLDMEKMKKQIRDLCEELSVTYDDSIGRPSCREDVGKLQENLKNIICFSKPHKDICLPCSDQLPSQRPEKGSSPEPEISPSTEKQLPSASKNETDAPTELQPLQATPPPQTIVDATPTVTPEKQLPSASPHKNKPTRITPLRTTIEPTSTVTGDKRPYRNRPLPTSAEGTPTVTGEKDRSKTAPPTTPVTPTRAGPERRSPAKSKQNSAIGDKETDDAMKSTGEIKTDVVACVEQVPKSICSVCCLGKTICPEEHPLSPYENPPASKSETTASPGPSPPNDTEIKSDGELIFVAPKSGEKKEFSMRAKQPQQATMRASTPAKKMCKPEKMRQGTGIPALDQTLRKYDLEMLAQSSTSTRYEYQTQTEPPDFYGVYHEACKYKCTDFMLPQKTAAATTTDEYLVVSGPVYIPAHVIEPHCSYAPFSPCLKSHSRTRRDLLLTDNYNNSRMHPDISMFYPTISTQTSSTDLALSDHPKSASGYKTFSSEQILLDTPPMVISSGNLVAGPMRFKEKEEMLQDSDLSHTFKLIETPKDRQKVKKELRMRDLIAMDVEEKKDQNLVSTDTLDGGEVDEGEDSEMFIVETKSSKEESDHLKHKVNQIIDMRGDEDDESEASSESISDGHFALKSSSSPREAAPKVKQAKKEESTEKEKVGAPNVKADDYMKKLDHKPDMSMTNSMANSIKKVNRDSQQFRNPDDKRITWGNRRLKIKKLTDSENEIGVIQEEEEQESDRHSIKSDNNRIDVA